MYKFYEAAMDIGGKIYEFNAYIEMLGAKLTNHYIFVEMQSIKSVLLLFLMEIGQKWLKVSYYQGIIYDYFTIFSYFLSTYVGHRRGFCDLISWGL